MELYKKPNRYSVAPECPCGKSNRDGKFVPFVEGSKIFSNAGYCHSCGKTFYPNEKVNIDFKNYEVNEIKKIEFNEIYQTLCNFGSNNFVLWLKSMNINIQEVLNYYKIGTGKDGSTIFWYIDYHGMARTAKIMYYNIDGHRNKNKTPCFIYTKKNGYESCLFGENLLGIASPYKVVVLVESEKTAVVGNSNFPDFIWIATGGSNGLTRKKAKILANRKVIVVPDCDAAGRSSAEKTKNILNEIKALVTICDINTTLNEGEDIADII